MLSFLHCLAFSRGRAKTIRIRCVWTGIFSETEDKILLFQKYPDTCGQGLNLLFVFFFAVFVFVAVVIA